MGGRVAIEAALTAPDVFRAVVPIAPYIPWLRFQQLMIFGEVFHPRLASFAPLELIWPVLHALSRAAGSVPYLRNDALAQAATRVVYFMSCPATRASLLDATRELTRDPASGEEGLWARMAGLRVPAAFLWGERDALVSSRFAARVARTVPEARQYMFPCLAHVLNGPHHDCLTATLATVLHELTDTSRGARARDSVPGSIRQAQCVHADSESGDTRGQDAGDIAARA